MGTQRDRGSRQANPEKLKAVLRQKYGTESFRRLWKAVEDYSTDGGELTPDDRPAPIVGRGSVHRLYHGVAVDQGTCAAIENVLGIRFEQIETMLIDVLLGAIFELAPPSIHQPDSRDGTLRDTEYRDVLFRFQFSTGEDLTVRSHDVCQWLAIARDRPVILIHTGAQSRRQSYLSLWQWLLDDEGSLHRLRSQPSITVESRLLRPIDTETAESRFRSEMRLEAERYLHDRGSPFRSRPTPSVPVSGIELLEYVGRLARLEVPAVVIREQAAVNSDSRSLTVALRRAIERGAPRAGVGREVATWLHSLELPVADDRIREEWRAFRMFVQALGNYQAGLPYELPAFNWRNMSSWRVFVQVFPAAIHMLEVVLRQRQSRGANTGAVNHDQILSAMLLVSTLANTEDSILRGQAVRLLRDVGDIYDHRRATRPDVYPVLRHYKFYRAESEGGIYVRDCVDFLARSERSYPRIDAEMMRGYYQSGNRGTVEAQRRKLANPKPRDVNTEVITQVILELAESDTARGEGASPAWLSDSRR